MVDAEAGSLLFVMLALRQYMSRNPERDAERVAQTRQKIVETGFRVFAERTIDASNLIDVAKAAGVAMPTVYRYFNSKKALVMEVGTWVWKQYTETYYRSDEVLGRTAAEGYAHFLDSFIDLYHNHRDILRFNQFFNIYVQRADIPADTMRPYNDVIARLAQRFHALYERAKVDGTLRTDIPEEEIFSSTLHLMLAVVTRYAVGLVYDSGIDPEEELKFQRDMLIRAYRVNP